MEKWDEDVLELISVMMAIAKAGWQHKVYYKEHPLGIVPCIELSKEFDGVWEYHTFVNAEHLWDWIRTPMD
jgi:hypothetical protein